MAASVKSRRACGPSFVFLARARSWDALKSPRNDTGIAMTNLHRSPPMNQSKTDLGIVNESQLPRFGITPSRGECRTFSGVTVVTNARVYYSTRAAADAPSVRHSLRSLISEGER